MCKGAMDWGHLASARLIEKEQIIKPCHLHPHNVGMEHDSPKNQKLQQCSEHPLEAKVEASMSP